LNLRWTPHNLASLGALRAQIPTEVKKKTLPLGRGDTGDQANGSNAKPMAPTCAESSKGVFLLSKYSLESLAECRRDNGWVILGD